MTSLVCACVHVHQDEVARAVVVLIGPAPVVASHLNLMTPIYYTAIDATVICTDYFWVEKEK